MTERKFTPPTEFPAEYVDGHGNKVTILGRSNNKHSPLIGFEHVGYARCWTEEGTCRHHDRNIDLHDMPKRITTWHNVYQDATLGYNSFTSRDQTFPHSVGLKGICVYRIERDEDGSNPEIFVEKQNE